MSLASLHLRTAVLIKTGNTLSTQMSPPLCASSTCTAFTKVRPILKPGPSSPSLTVHLVNDVFHTGPPDSTVWEFKHGNGSFKRGDLIGLREIKRRASRHALIQRDSFSSVKGIGNPNSGAVTPNEHGSDLDTRLMSFEHTLYDLSNRMSRTEDANARLAMKCQKLTEGLSKFQQVCPREYRRKRKELTFVQWTLDLSTKVSAAFPQDSPVQRDCKFNLGPSAGIDC